jgi:hypothetical protein
MATGQVEWKMMSPDTTLVPVAEIVLTPLADGEGVLLDVDSARYIRLNKTALVIWTAIERGEPIKAISRALLERFDVNEEQADETLQSFVDELIKENLITVQRAG